MINGFLHKTDTVAKRLFLAILAICLLAAVYFFASDNFLTGIISLVTPFVILLLSVIILKPEIGFLLMFIINYFAMGIARYLPGPLGLAVDGLLLLTWIAVIFSQFNRKVEWKNALNTMTVLSIIWFAYAIFEMVNPEAVSKEAWFYAMRGVSLYMFLVIPLTFILLSDKKYLNRFIQLWAIFTLIAIAKGVMQKFLGPDPWEQRWLAEGAAKTHLLPGGLRVFSILSDAATYGGAMGFSGVVFLIISFHTKQIKPRLFYLFVGVGAIYAMFISGTRGAIAVPFAGFTLYSILNKKVKILLISGLTIFIVFAVLKYTTIGNNVYEIRRFRGGLDKNNDSYQVRVENQKKFSAYLASRPFGGGIGSAGNWGLRFSPGTFLAETPPDGWYIQIWAEQGIVGLYLHLLILAFIILKSAYLIMFKIRSPELKTKAIALISGIFGVMAASYSSSALGQMPNGIIIYISVAFIFMMPDWEKRENFVQK